MTAFITHANQELKSVMYSPAANRPGQCNKAPFSERILAPFWIWVFSMNQLKERLNRLAHSANIGRVPFIGRI